MLKRLALLFSSLTDEGIIPPNAALCVSNDGVSKYTLADHTHVNASHTQQTLPRGTLKEQCTIEKGANGTWGMQPATATCSYDPDMQSYVSVSNHLRFERIPFTSKIYFRAVIVCRPPQRLEELGTIGIVVLVLFREFPTIHFPGLSCFAERIKPTDPR